MFDAPQRATRVTSSFIKEALIGLLETTEWENTQIVLLNHVFVYICRSSITWIESEPELIYVNWAQLPYYGTGMVRYGAGIGLIPIKIIEPATLETQPNFR